MMSDTPTDDEPIPAEDSHGAPNSSDAADAQNAGEPAYQVGYKRPPLKSRFQPGQSGNPRGKQPGVKDLKTDLREELSQRVTITENGKSIKVSKQRVILKALAAKAAKGNVAAADKLLSLIIQSFGFEDTRNRGPELNAAQQAMIDALVARLADDDVDPDDEEPAPAEAGGPEPDDNDGGAAVAILYEEDN